jgi:hypothetical protein
LDFLALSDLNLTGTALENEKTSRFVRGDSLPLDRPRPQAKGYTKQESTLPLPIISQKWEKRARDKTKITNLNHRMGFDRPLGVTV